MNNAQLNDTTDQHLIEAAANGDATAFARIVEQHQGMVYRTCLRVLRNEADAQDAAQATFILFHQKCQKLKQGIVLGGWLYRTAELVCREFMRSSGRRKRREEEAVIMNETNVTNNEEIWNRLQPELDAALTALTPRYHDVVVLRYLEGKSTNETAAVMGTSASVVTTRLARAMEQLHAWFQGRGIGLTAAALAALLAENASAAAVPPALAPSILGATGAGAAVTAASSANTSLMVKGGLAKMSSVGWLFWHAFWMLAYIDCMNQWVGHGCPIPRWVHVFAASMWGAGLVAMVTLAAMGMLTWGLAAACLLIPPAAAYFGWLWMFGPNISKPAK